MKKTIEIDPRVVGDNSKAAEIINLLSEYTKYSSKIEPLEEKRSEIKTQLGTIMKKLEVEGVKIDKLGSTSLQSRISKVLNRSKLKALSFTCPKCKKVLEGLLSDIKLSEAEDINVSEPFVTVRLYKEKES